VSYESPSLSRSLPFRGSLILLLFQGRVVQLSLYVFIGFALLLL